MTVSSPSTVKNLGQWLKHLVENMEDVRREGRSVGEGVSMQEREGKGRMCRGGYECREGVSVGMNVQRSCMGM